MGVGSGRGPSNYSEGQGEVRAESECIDTLSMYYQTIHVYVCYQVSFAFVVSVEQFALY